MIFRKPNSRLHLPILMMISVIGVALLSACSSDGGFSVKPKFLTFNYHQSENAAAGNIASSIREGTADFDGFMPSNPCNFTADFSVRGPNISVSGEPGEEGANINITSVNPVNIATNPEILGCGSIDEIVISIGSRSDTLNLGEPTDIGSASVTLSGDFYSTLNSGYFTATLNSYDSSYVTGEFKFLMRKTGHRDSMLFVAGTFAGN